MNFDAAGYNLHKSSLDPYPHPHPHPHPHFTLEVSCVQSGCRSLYPGQNLPPWAETCRRTVSSDATAIERPIHAWKHGIELPFVPCSQRSLPSYQPPHASFFLAAHAQRGKNVAIIYIYKHHFYGTRVKNQSFRKNNKACL